MTRLPTNCPSCQGNLEVKNLGCTDCETEVSGSFPLSLLSRLEPAEQEFILQFVIVSGSLKEMATIMGVSYPTVRNRLNEVIEKLNQSKLETELEDE